MLWHAAHARACPTRSAALLCAAACALPDACAPPPRPPPLQVHEKIRANPVHAKKARSAPKEKKHWKEVALTYEQRKANLKEKLATLMEDE